MLSYDIRTYFWSQRFWQLLQKSIYSKKIVFLLITINDLEIPYLLQFLAEDFIWQVEPGYF